MSIIRRSVRRLLSTTQSREALLGLPVVARLGTDAKCESQRKHYTYLVIGGGSGGVASARRAASYGARVALIEQKALGGTCVNVGCVPKKVMWNTATLAETMHHAHHFGFFQSAIQPLQGKKGGSAFGFDWKTIKERRDAYIHRLNGIYRNLLRDSGVDLYEGLATFKGQHEVRVNGVVVTADQILIATGGHPVLPPIPGAKHCISSDGFFELDRLPSRVAVIGAGYIAVEMAGIFNALGSDTNLFVRYDGPLRAFDGILRDGIKREMAATGLKLHPNSTPSKISKDPTTGRLSLALVGGEVHPDFDCILLAVGRRPETEELGLQHIGIRLGPKGHIEVDDYQSTSVPGLYAIGDVCGKVELTPMAIAAGRRLADRLFGQIKEAKVEYDLVPTVIFNHPPLGTVGMTEEQARKEYPNDSLKVYTSTFVNLWYGPWAVPPESKPKTAMKLICQGPQEKIVGFHVIGMGADEMLQGYAVAIKMGATKADLDACVAIHPTAAEEGVTLAPWGLSGPEYASARQRIQQVAEQRKAGSSKL